MHDGFSWGSVLIRLDVSIKHRIDPAILRRLEALDRFARMDQKVFEGVILMI